MQRKLNALYDAVEDEFGGHGLSLIGLRMYEADQGQRKRRELYGCFQAMTDNINFFGENKYENFRRIGLLNLLNKTIGKLNNSLPYGLVALDVRVGLTEAYHRGEPIYLGSGESVDVTTHHDVELVSLEEALRTGEAEEGTVFTEYARRYGLKHVLRHGYHYISPDTASVEALEAALEIRIVKSILEIGGGTGVCGVAAEQHGIQDFTFADMSSVVCGYLKKRFHQFNVVEADALKMKFDRKWDIALVGIPYELNPEFLMLQGKKLAESADLVVFQSGCMEFFSFEHDWVMGNDPTMKYWDWWKKEQSIYSYFPYVFEAAFDWQTCIVAGHDKDKVWALRQAMNARGFQPIRANHLA